MKYLKLTNTILKAFVDDEDYARCKKYNWRMHPDGYVQSCSVDFNSIAGDRHIQLQVFIMNTTVGLDHKDHNKLNNQKSNLRPATYSQQRQNTGKQIQGTSKYKGVSASNGSWMARITLNKKTKYLGTFMTELEAAKAYNRAAKKYFGEFAAPNLLIDVVQ